MFQAVVMFCLLGGYGPTCETVYPEPVSRLDVCEKLVALSVERVYETVPEIIEVWAFGYCRPVERPA